MKTRMDKYKALRDEIELECLLDQNVFDSKDSLLVVKNDKPTYEQLEKALDKACRELSDNEECTTLDNYCHTEEEWKAWLLK